MLTKDATKQCQWCARVLGGGSSGSSGSSNNNNSLPGLLHCGGCQSTYYCDAGCQRKDWVAHKPRCVGSGTAEPLALTNFAEVSYLLQQLYQQMDADARGNRGGKGGTKSHQGRQGRQSRDAIVQVLGVEEPLDLLWSRFVEVRASDYVHGRGLFATRALPAHAAVTFHPAHLLVDAQGSIYSTERENVARLRQDSTKMAALLADHSCVLDTEGRRLVGQPERCDDQRLLGHMVNDAALVDVFASTPVEELRDRRVLRRLIVCFLKNALKYTNCAYMSDARALVRCLVTRREIQPGEELLVSYGLGYWLERNYGARAVERHPFIGSGMRELCQHDQEFRQLLLKATLELDAPVILTSLALHQYQQQASPPPPNTFNNNNNNNKSGR